MLAANKTTRPISVGGAVALTAAMIAMSFALTVMLIFPLLPVAAVLLAVTGQQPTGEAGAGWLIAVIITWLVYWSLVVGVALHYRNARMYVAAFVAALAGPLLQYVALATW